MKRRRRATVAISGVWLRTGEGGRLELLVEVEGRWRLMPPMGNGERYLDGQISQIWEALAMSPKHAKLDPLTEGEGR